MMLSGWGRYPVVECRLARLRRGEDLPALAGRHATLIARGNGRSYGDAALNPDLTLSMLAMDRMLAFDAATGLLTCEAGVPAGGCPRDLRAAGLVPPRSAGHEVRHGGRHDRRRRARQEPSSGRDLRGTRRVADARHGRRGRPGVQPRRRRPPLPRDAGRHGADRRDPAGELPAGADRDRLSCWRRRWPPATWKRRWPCSKRRATGPTASPGSTVLRGARRWAARC